MAIIRLTGFESGDLNEVIATGTASAVSSGQRTGSYALRVNPTTTGTGSVGVWGIDATGPSTVSNSIADGVFFGFAFKAATLPASGEEYIARIRGVTTQIEVSLSITSGGVLKLYAGSVTAGTLIGTGTTVIGNSYKYIELNANNTTNAYSLLIDGVSELSGTSASIGSSGIALILGKVVDVSGQTVDFYYDDVYVDDTAFLSTTTSFPQVKILLPNAAGTNSGWTGGTNAKTFAEVKEVPTDGDTTYIEAAATDDNKSTTFRVQSTTTGGITGTIKAVEGYVWADTASAAGTSTVAIRVNNGASNADKTGLELTTSYQALHNLTTTDPATSAAWTSGGVDTVEVGMTAATIAQTQRFSTAYIFVLSLVSSGAPAPNVSDSTAVSDTPTINLLSYINVSDASTTTDTPTIEQINFLSVTDSSAIGETVTVSIISVFSVTDSTTVNETVTIKVSDPQISVTDSSAVGETVTVTVSAPQISVTDSSIVSESVTVAIISVLNVADSSAIGETITMALFSNISVTDSSAVGEISTMSGTENINVTDTSAVTDTIVLEDFEQGVVISDSTAVTDTATLSLTSYINVTDSSAIGESVSLTVGVALPPLSIDIELIKVRGVRIIG